MFAYSNYSDILHQTTDLFSKYENSTVSRHILCDVGTGMNRIPNQSKFYHNQSRFSFFVMVNLFSPQSQISLFITL